MSRLRVVALGALAGVLVAAGCAGSTKSRSSNRGPLATSPGGTTAGSVAVPTPAPLQWSGCGSHVECAHLDVPMDYAHPQQGAVTLAVARRQAQDPGQRIGSLVVNPGGPGASGVDMVKNGFGLDNGFADRFDIVSWDPRGVGQSAGLACGQDAPAFLARDPDPTTAVAQQQLDTAARQVAVTCTKAAQPLLDHLDTATTAQDLEQLRLALGEGGLNYAGYSYGTLIGLTYAQRFSTHVRAMVLDGVVDPRYDLEDLLRVQTNALDQALQRTFDHCSGDATCPLSNAAGAYDQLARKLATGPALPGGARGVGPAELATAAVESTYEPELGRQFLQALATAVHGDGNGIAELADRYRRSVTNYATYVGTLCTDLPHPNGAADYEAFAKELRQRSPRLGAAVANEVLPCAFWGAPVTGRPGVVAAEGSPPILVVGNTGDAATPLASAQSVARHLANGVLVTYDGSGHTSVGRSSCVDATLRRYLEDLRTPPAGTLCQGTG